MESTGGKIERYIDFGDYAQSEQSETLDFLGDQEGYLDDGDTTGGY